MCVAFCWWISRQNSTLHIPCSPPATPPVNPTCAVTRFTVPGGIVGQPMASAANPGDCQNLQQTGLRSLWLPSLHCWVARRLCTADWPRRFIAQQRVAWLICWHQCRLLARIPDSGAGQDIPDPRGQRRHARHGVAVLRGEHLPGVNMLPLAEDGPAAQYELALRLLCYDTPACHRSKGTVQVMAWHATRF